jgi:hypothetical protein
LQTICPDCLWTEIPLISPSWVAKISGYGVIHCELSLNPVWREINTC